MSLKNQLHAVSRTQQGRQRELSVKTLRSPHVIMYVNCGFQNYIYNIRFSRPS